MAKMDSTDQTLGMCLSPERCLSASSAYGALRRMGADVVGLYGSGPSSHVDTRRVHGPAQPRKHTKFETCERHRWLDGETRYRRAEFFIEGGPANESGCKGGKCRLWPGTDLFVATICGSEYELEWTKAPSDAR